MYVLQQAFERNKKLLLRDVNLSSREFCLHFCEQSGICEQICLSGYEKKRSFLGRHKLMFGQNIFKGGQCANVENIFIFHENFFLLKRYITCYIKEADTKLPIFETCRRHEWKIDSNRRRRWQRNHDKFFSVIPLSSETLNCITPTKISSEGGRPGLVVTGGDSSSEGRGFRSLDVHFFTLICCIIVLMFVWKRPKINEKETGVGPFLIKKRSSQK